MHFRILNKFLEFINENQNLRKGKKEWIAPGRNLAHDLNGAAWLSRRTSPRCLGQRCLTCGGRSHCGYSRRGHRRLAERRRWRGSGKAPRWVGAFAGKGDEGGGSPRWWHIDGATREWWCGGVRRWRAGGGGLWRPVRVPTSFREVGKGEARRKRAEDGWGATLTREAKVAAMLGLNTR
jgi:hypothetical protein